MCLIIIQGGVRRACIPVQSQDGSVGRTKQAERHRRPVIDANKMAGLYGYQGSRKLVAELVAKWLDKCTQDGELLRRIMDHGSWCVIHTAWRLGVRSTEMQSAECRAHQQECQSDRSQAVRFECKISSQRGSTTPITNEKVYKSAVWLNITRNKTCAYIQSSLLASRIDTLFSICYVQGPFGHSHQSIT